MKILFIYLTYNRPKVLSECLRTSFSNTKIVPEELWILDDGSKKEVQASLVQFSLDNREKIPINLILNQKNYGIGWGFEMAYNLMRTKNPEYVFFIESDYVFRQEYLEDCMAVFEANKNVIAIPGCSHPDMYDRKKTHELFPKLMMEQFPTDVVGREHMYKSFELETSRGKILVQGASNSCGCHLFAWQRFQAMLEDLDVSCHSSKKSIDEYWTWMDRAFNKQSGGDRKYASDQHLSCTPTWYWYEWAKRQGDFDLSKNFPFLDICDASIAQHLCGQGINGGIVAEGETFVGSPVWKGEKFERQSHDSK